MSVKELGYEDGFKKLYTVMRQKMERAKALNCDFVEYCRGYFEGVKALEEEVKALEEEVKALE